VRFRILGPLRVHDGTGWLPIPAPKQRLVLSALVMAAGQVVGTQRLAHLIWGDQPPPTAAKTVTAYVMRLRRLLGEDGTSLVATRDRGYELVVDQTDLDVWEFERLAGAGRRELAGGRPAAALDHFTEALALWRGPVLADVPDRPAWAARVTQLEQARLTVTEDRLRALLELDRHPEALDQLHRLVEEQPLREPLWTLLMRAQHACGRRADALETFQRARRVLSEELGLEPGEPLQRLQREVLADQPGTAPEPRQREPVVVPAQLPGDVHGFTGRDEQLKHLDTLAELSVPASAVTISVIAGTAGVGKTALAVHWAHRARDRFPDGQLYANLRGYADGPPARPIEALARFLRALGVPPERIPSDVDEASALYRSVLAGRRMLVLLDNARTAEQVRPLLPGDAGCLALVTSRDQLASLAAHDGARRLSLDVLDADDARLLLARLVGMERVQAEADDAAALVRLCGYLPLAVRIAAANLGLRAHATIASYTTRLRHDRLDGLRLEGGGVRAAFGLSYTALPADARRLFRLLGLNPGQDLAVPAAAALAGIDAAAADQLLARLAACHLVEEHASGRYTMHDLLRCYAADLATEEETEPDRRAALQRLFRHYLRLADAAARIQGPERIRLPFAAPDPAEPSCFTDLATATSWLDAEIANLVATVVYTATHGPHATAWELADRLRGYFLLRFLPVEWETAASAALTAAQAAGDPPGLAAAHLNLGALASIRERHEQEEEHNRRAAGHARAAGWTLGEAAALGNLATGYLHQGRLRDARRYYRDVLDIHDRTGSVAHTAITLENLGRVHYELGDIEAAADVHARAVEVYRGLDSPQTARSVTALGIDYHWLGRLPEALRLLSESVDAQSAAGDHGWLGYTRVGLARVHRDLGNHREASQLVAAALATARDYQDLWLENLALLARAGIHRYTGDPASAVGDLERALLSLYRFRGHILTAWAETELAGAHQQAGDGQAAAEHLHRALALCREYGCRLVQGCANAVLAAVRLSDGDPEGAREPAALALRIHTRAGHRLGVAQAHLVAADASSRTGELGAAADHRRAASTIFTELGTDPALHAALLGLPTPR
jgi:DNA-binding SARP family transcriptional activator